MEWIESVILTKPEGIEIVSAVLIEAGITGFQIEDPEYMKRFIEENSTNWDYIDNELEEQLLKKATEDTSIIFYVPSDVYGNEILIDIKSKIESLKTQDLGLDLGKLMLTAKNVDDKDWLDNWKKYFKPFKVGQNIIIKPTWENYTAQKDDIVFNINPGHVFGTGLHQSTKMCINALEKCIKSGDKIADLGCGSGILSVISLMLGAEYAFACDIESPAQNVAYENAKLNGIDDNGKYEVVIGNILSDKDLQKKLADIKFDLIVANIVADVIIELSDIVPSFIKEDGIFIVSGIIKQRLEEVTTALEKSGFEIIKIDGMDEWNACTTKYKGK